MNTLLWGYSDSSETPFSKCDCDHFIHCEYISGFAQNLAFRNDLLSETLINFGTNVSGLTRYLLKVIHALESLQQVEPPKMNVYKLW